jgi:hypothetical protein
MPVTFLQVDKTPKRMLVSFKIEELDDTKSRDIALIDSIQLSVALYFIASALKAGDFNVEIKGEGLQRLRSQFAHEYDGLRGQEVGKTFFYNTAFVFIFDRDSNAVTVKAMKDF